MPPILIGLDGGLYRLDHDASIPRCLMPGIQPTALAADPSNPMSLYCSTYDRGLWRSRDGGETWRPAGTPQRYFGSPVAGTIGPRETTFVSVSPCNGDRSCHIVWVGTEPSSLYRSDDGGDTFRLVSDFQEQASRANWAFPPRPKTHHVRWIAHGEAGQVYVSIEFGALLRSLDGVRFEDRHPDSPFDTHVLRTHPDAPGRLYAALGDGLMTHGRSFGDSRDAGASWRYLGEGFGNFVYLYGMDVNPADPNDVRVAASPSPEAAHQSGPSSIFRLVGDAWIEDAEGFPVERSLAPVIAADQSKPGHWLALSNLGLFVKGPDDGSWVRVTDMTEWEAMHPTCLLTIDSA